MLGISEGNVLEHVEGEGRTPEYDPEDAAKLAYNPTDPLVISDGIDRVTVAEEADDRYLVDYWGYEAGYLRITQDGVVELGESLLGSPATVPIWILTAPDDPTEWPWWIPDDYDGEPILTCDQCGSDTPAGEILTPSAVDEATAARFCPGCWEVIGDRWDPEVGLREPDAVKQARTLHEAAKADPERVDREAIDALVRSVDLEAQWKALLALDLVSEGRPEAALDFLPVLTDRLESDDDLVRAAASYCLATIAEEYPRQVTPVADDVVGLLDPETDDGILEGAIPFISAVADAEPRAVLDAVPRLAALLQANAPCEQDTVVALMRIGKAYPESIRPVTTELLTYVDTDGASNQVAAMAALGHVAKEYPDVAQSAIPTLVELLDAEPFRVRGNAAGLLADLADEYPEEVRPALDRVIELLDDEEDKIRYNATSILARLAKAYPDEVEPAVNPLIEALDEEFAYARLNACWALGYLGAESAREALEEITQSDPDEEVRESADWALHQLDR